MTELWGVAFAAGMVSTINPCGFAMLPAYLSYFLGLEGAEEDHRASMARSLAVGGVVSLGFIVVFGVAGLLLNAGADLVRDWLPYFALVVGGGLVVLGIAMLRGYQMKVRLPTAQGGTSSREWRSVFLFGTSYALASLSCTLPVFLIVVVSSLSGEGFVTGLGTFLAYGLGMSLVLMSLTITMGAAQTGLLSKLRRAMQHVNRISAVLLIVAGAYIVWFWTTELLTDATDVSFAERLVDSWSGSLTRFIERNDVFFGFTFAGIVAAAITSVLWRPALEVETLGASGTAERVEVAP